jgi:hypothetical protein
MEKIYQIKEKYDNKEKIFLRILRSSQDFKKYLESFVYCNVQVCLNDLEVYLNTGYNYISDLKIEDVEDNIKKVSYTVNTLFKKMTAYKDSYTTKRKLFSVVKILDKNFKIVTEWELLWRSTSFDYFSTDVEIRQESENKTTIVN